MTKRSSIRITCRCKESLHASSYSRLICTGSACFAGTRIVLRQVSPESESIYDFIIHLHKAFNGDWKQVQQKSGVTDAELASFLDYAAQFLGNTGNYKSFGDSKFGMNAPWSLACE
jgi:hypothetical protein